MLPSGECEDFCVTDLILSGKEREGGDKGGTLQKCLNIIQQKPLISLRVL